MVEPMKLLVEKKTRGRAGCNVSTTIKQFFQLVNLDSVRPLFLDLAPQAHLLPPHQLLRAALVETLLKSSLQAALYFRVACAELRAPSQIFGARVDVLEDLEQLLLLTSACWEPCCLFHKCWRDEDEDYYGEVRDHCTGWRRKLLLSVFFQVVVLATSL